MRAGSMSLEWVRRRSTAAAAVINVCASAAAVVVGCHSTRGASGGEAGGPPDSFEAGAAAGGGSASAGEGGNERPAGGNGSVGGHRSSDGGAPEHPNPPADDGGSKGDGGAAGASAGAAGTTSAGGGGATTSGDSLIGNGHFDDGMEGWGVEITGGGPVAIESSGGRLCVESDTSAAQVVLGWPRAPFTPLTLEPGVDYTVSFRAVGTRAIQVQCKLGLVSSPYTPYSTQFVEVSGTWQTYSQSFALNSGSQSIGVAISFTLGALDAVCIDDVRLTSP